MKYQIFIGPKQRIIIVDSLSFTQSDRIRIPFSVEGEGDGICFNVFCYNVQPGISINYENGGSSASGSEQAKSVETSEKTEAVEAPEQAEKTDTQTTQGGEATYILNTNTKKFHLPSCSSVSQMNESNKETYTGSREGSISQGYAPCKRCDP